MLNHVPTEIYISSANVDVRKGLDSFASVVEQQFKLDPMSGAMFVFHNRHCDKIKILYKTLFYNLTNFRKPGNAIISN